MKVYKLFRMNELMREYLAASGFNETLTKCPGEEDADRKLKQFKKFKKVTMKRKKSLETPKLSFEVS